MIFSHMHLLQNKYYILYIIIHIMTHNCQKQTVFERETINRSALSILQSRNETRLKCRIEQLNYIINICFVRVSGANTNLNYLVSLSFHSEVR